MGTWSEIFSCTQLFSGKSVSWKSIDFKAHYPEEIVYTTTATCKLLA